ncbi:MAG TPA: fibronectin type III domain-containing protein, partial [Candidatus Bathyarchaeia archaeon]|nr:fibronectin type III domain-containing protein [Candidatus Bathyarchaeia archaeon]
SQNHKIFAASGKQTPGINSTQAKIAVVNITALKDFNGAGITLVPVGTDMSATSAAILDDGKGTNVLVAVMSRFTNPADTTAPVVSNGSPSGALPSGTTSKTLAVTTNEKSACKYSTSSGTAYADMTNSFSTSDGISHSANISGLTDGKSYNYYVRCIDTAVIPNVDTSDYKISFSINSPAPQDVTPPTISGGSPTGTLAAGTAQATLKVSTNENATCKYSTTSGTAYSSMSNTFSTTGSTSHSTSISGLIDGKSYSYFVRCRDAAGNATTNDYPVSFSVASSQAFGPIISSVSAKTLSLSSVVVTWKTDKPATSQVEYGTTTSYGNSTSLDSNLVTSHSQDLTGLSKNIRYHFRVRSKDANGNETVSGDSVFRARNK